MMESEARGAAAAVEVRSEAEPPESAVPVGIEAPGPDQDDTQPHSAVPQAPGVRQRTLQRRERWALGILLVCVVLFGVNFKLARVVGHSMEPTFHDGQVLLVWRTASLFSPYRVGDVIVFRAPDGGELIKRIAFIQKPDGSERMPRELWTLHGKLPVPVLLWGTHHYAFPGYVQGIEDGRSGHLVRKTVFVMGDNTWASEDSRVFGPIDPGTILGKVLIKRRK